MNVLVVYCHPDPASFVASVRERAVAAQGCEAIAQWNKLAHGLHCNKPFRYNALNCHNGTQRCTATAEKARNP